MVLMIRSGGPYGCLPSDPSLGQVQAEGGKARNRYECKGGVVEHT